MEEKRRGELSLTLREKSANSGEEGAGGPPLVRLSCLGVRTYTPRRSPGKGGPHPPESLSLALSILPPSLSSSLSSRCSLPGHSFLEKSY